VDDSLTLSMSCLLTISAAQVAVFPARLLAQSSEPNVGVSQQQAMKESNHEVKQLDRSFDFTFYVMVPFVICLGLIVFGMRLLG
jgi:hypothetical protein